MDYLDESQLDFWIEVLSEAKRIGYSLSSSPVELLLETMVDFALKLSNVFEQGSGTWSGRKNAALKFSEKAVDSLGNPKVLKIREQEVSTLNPQLSFYFRELAKQLVEVKRRKELPENLYSSEQPKPAHQKIRQTSYHFFRRQARRKRK